jgi:hypothetical protein
MPHTQSVPPAVDVDEESRRPTQFGARFESGHGGQGRLPKLQFTKFTGEDPQLWKSCCENYFNMYGVKSSLWDRVAAMHLDGAAARWWQLVERHLQSASWEEFSAQLHDRFGRDQHEALIQ